VPIRERDTLELLQADLLDISRKTPTAMRGVVRDGIRAGNLLAQDYAKLSAGRHGKLYPRAMSAEMGSTFTGYGATVVTGEYGPDIAKPQGGMSFERGSRNQKPHLDLARSADRIGPSFQMEAGRMADDLFRGFGRQRGRLF
jgi:hypothetical protein